VSPPGGSSPEQFARQEIDKLLTEAGWIVQNRDEINLGAGRGIAIREFRLAEGFGYADYQRGKAPKSVGQDGRVRSRRLSCPDE